MSFGGFVRKLFASKRPSRPDVPDDVTTDKYLRGLRRERRVQLEEREKEVLTKQIEAHKKARERRFLWGVGERNLIGGSKGVSSRRQSYLGRGRL